jgi:hypothetical protein
MPTMQKDAMDKFDQAFQGWGSVFDRQEDTLQGKEANNDLNQI